MSNDIEVVRRVVSKGREFYSEGTYGVADSLKACSDAGYQPLFMPELAMARADADKDSRLWQTWFLAPSVKVTGKSRQGNTVVVYAHVPTSLSDPTNVRTMIDKKALVNGTGPMLQEEFYDLLDQEGNRVFVVDYNKLRRSVSGDINVDDALSHPQTIPFLGGKQNAQAYLAKHKEVYGKNIGVWHRDDLDDRPVGRVLYLGSDYYDGLGGDDVLDGDGRVLGVAPEAQVVAHENGAPQLPLESRVQKLGDGELLTVDGELYVRAPKRLVLSDR